MGAGNGTSVRRLAIIGLDGATFRVLDPLSRLNVMPALVSLRDRATQGILRSTIPSYTPPAWVSMATGVNPGRHGILGFLANSPQRRPQVAHSGLIASPPIWRFLNELELRAGIFNVPMSYPPTNVDGFMVSGGLAAGWTKPELPNFVTPPSLGQLITKVGGRNYPVDTVVNYEKDWRSPAIIGQIEEVQKLRRVVLAALLEEVETDVVFAVFEGPDRLLHLHYQHIVEGSDWYGASHAAEARDRAFSYFSELDRAIADLVDWAGTDGVVAVVSDHGFGPWEKTLNVNVLLEEWGYLTLPPVSRLTRSHFVSGMAQRMARRFFPRRILHRMKAEVGRRINWSRTRAFASHVAEQGVHINERGPLPEGIVDGADVGRLEEELIDRLLGLRDPQDNKPVTDIVLRRDEVLAGPFAARAPHLFPLCRDQRYELSDTLAASSAFTDHRDRPWGYHHRDGIFIAAGTDVASGTLPSGLDIVDVLPTVLHTAGLPVPTGLDGRVVTDLLKEQRPVSTLDMQPHHQLSTAYPFSSDEEAAIEESLRGLGYLE